MRFIENSHSERFLRGTRQRASDIREDAKDIRADVEILRLGSTDPGKFEWDRALWDEFEELEKHIKDLHRSRT